MERRIVSSQAVVSDDGSVGLRLELDDATTLIAELDKLNIEILRQQLAKCEQALDDPTTPAE